MNHRYRHAFYKFLPGFLGGGTPHGAGAGDEADGERVAYSLSFMVDAFLERLESGLHARWPKHAPDDALPYLGRDRKIVRGINEPSAAYAARLERWLIDHKVRGNPYALLDQLAAYLQTPVLLRTVDARGNWFTRNADGTRDVLLATGNWDWDGAPATSFSKFWVLIYAWSAPTLVQRDGTWGDGETWGAQSDSTWGSTFTADQVVSMRGIVREWKPDGTRCVNIIVSFDESDSSFDPLNGNSDPGTWGEQAKLSGGAWVPTRSGTAIYLDGTGAPWSGTAWVPDASGNAVLQETP